MPRLEMLQIVLVWWAVNWKKAGRASLCRMPVVGSTLIVDAGVANHEREANGSHFCNRD
jgi:hypothetical protein